MDRKIFITAIAFLLNCNNVVLAQSNEELEMTVINLEGKEETIDVPEAMATEVDSLLKQYYAENYLLPDENCNYENVNVTFPAEVYIDRLGRMPNVMEMPYNNIVQGCIDRYTDRLRRSVGYMLGAANFYMPIFEEALEAYGLPLELKYLPVIESALNPKATSRAGAGGLWQFMPQTGKQYGLEINSLVDERRDPVKSSYAAARFLRDLYKIFGDWNLVIAAYNCGPGNVNKAILRSNGKADYWSIYPYLPRETRGYVPAFIAANYVMNYYCEHNICPMRTKLPAKSDTIMLTRDVHFKQISDICGIDIEELRTLNPQYRRDIVNGGTKPSSLRLPASLISTFINNEDTIYNHQADVLFTRRSLVEVNDDPVSTSSSNKYKSKKKRSRRSKSVTVRKGQTLSEIARRHGTTVSNLRRLNGIKGSNIRAGKKIRVR